MELKPGYKLTEVGVIPEDWEMQPLRTALSSSPKYGINAAAIPYQGKYPAYIRITDISEDGHFHPEKLVAVDHPNASQYFLEEGDLVFARTGASVGKSYLYDPNDGELVYAGFLIKIRPNKNILLSKFLSHYVKTQPYWNWVQVMSMRSGQPGINGNEYGQLLLPLPTVEEQRAIATTLSDIDALLDSLDRLIAKKRDLKQAAMQQLLTGKKRLPGFGEGKGYQKTEIGVIPEDWEVKPLGALGTFKNGINKGKEDFGHGFPFINLMDVFGIPKISASKDFGLVNSTTAERDLYSLKGGDVLFVRSSVKPEGVGLTTLIPQDLPNTVFSGFLIRFRDSGLLELGFKEHFFLDEGFRARLIANSTVSANTNINQDALKRLQIALPPTGEEQTAIATILSDMNAEITSLEQRRDKTRALKQGMMQELLTGKTRLIPPGGFDA